MNHNKSYRKLGRRADHRKAMLKNMTISLVVAERIETTVTRAKELRKFAERMITFGKKNTLASRRNCFAFLRSEEAVAKIFNELAPKYAERNGGYTRIIKTSVRKGDSAEMAIIELV
nr:50S ribosomal protein L17 [uncultured Fusobacterium sp.]